MLHIWGYVSVNYAETMDQLVQALQTIARKLIGT